MRCAVRLLGLALAVGVAVAASAEGRRVDRPPGPRVASGGQTTTAWIQRYCLRGRRCRITEPPAGERWPVLAVERGAVVRIDTRWPARRVRAEVIMECDIGVGVRVSRVGESRRRWRLRLPAKIPTDTLDIEALYTRRRGSVEATVRLQGLLPTPCGPSVLPTSLPPPAG